MSSPKSSGRAWVHALVDPGLVVTQEAWIRKRVFKVLDIASPANHQVDVSRTSGWITYTALGEIWDRPTPPTLPTRDVALRRAEAFLKTLAQALSPASSNSLGENADSPFPKQLEGVAIFPTFLLPVQFSVVPRREGDIWDHWLYRAQPQIAINEKQKVAVLGAVVEVRVGHAGQIISYHSRWTPITRETITTDLYKFQALEDEHQDSTTQKGDSKEPVHSLHYVLEGDRIPQFYLSPYYLVQHEDHSVLQSACEWSLTVELGRDQVSEDEMIITARVEGGHDAYTYHWAKYQVDNLESGHVSLGPGITSWDENGLESNSIQLSAGSYVIMLHVRDQETGAFKHYQQQVFSSPSEWIQINPSKAGSTP
jgi:hypothetical protein